MAPKSYRWITGWFLVTGPIMIWDAGYCLMRPRSMVGGDLNWFWKTYEWYGQIDYVYGDKAFHNGEGFAGGAAILNLIEIFTSLIYLILVYIIPSDIAPLVGYTGATMTLAKTLLYLAQEYFCGGCAIGHNSFRNMFLFWIAPNIVWTTFSALIIYRLGKDITSSLRTGKSIKTQ